MKILAIETSCDETGIAIVDVTETKKGVHITVCADVLLSQAMLHAQYGGVYPSLAKREHAKNIGPLFVDALQKANLYHTSSSSTVTKEALDEIKDVLHREQDLFSYLVLTLAQIQRPAIDAIAVTHGPGLEPALWVGVNFARALSIAWNIPLLPINHLAGHVATALAKQESDNTFLIRKPNFPAIILLISGGHTELVVMKNWLEYEKIGSTRDDAVGEAFDKSARLLGLPYPGGPEISKCAHDAREENLAQPFSLPRPMIDADNHDFSFSGLKTAVRTLVEDIGELNKTHKKQIARELEDAITETLVKKVQNAIDAYDAHALIVGGGVSANTTIRAQLSAMVHEYADVSFHVAAPTLATDNGVMIAFAAAISDTPPAAHTDISASGNLKLY
tara:strand:- start:8916 stop:10088 length:1173 start_codon:yes stop_codon:yes gene_type:complete